MSSQVDGRKSRGAATRDSMLDAAAELLEVHGYAGTSMNDVVARSGAPKGSLYHHFPGGKKELVILALERTGMARAAEIEAALIATESAAEAARLIIAVFGDRLVDSDFTIGCPIAPVVLDSDDDEILTACGQIYAGWIALLQERLASEGRNADEAFAQAETLFATIQGALILARATRNRGPLDRLAAQVDQLLLIAG